jgi:hypothetical protein
VCVPPACMRVLLCSTCALAAPFLLHAAERRWGGTHPRPPRTRSFVCPVAPPRTRSYVCPVAPCASQRSWFPCVDTSNDRGTFAVHVAVGTIPPIILDALPLEDARRNATVGGACERANAERPYRAASSSLSGAAVVALRHQPCDCSPYRSFPPPIPMPCGQCPVWAQRPLPGLPLVVVPVVAAVGVGAVVEAVAAALWTSGGAARALAELAAVSGRCWPAGRAWGSRQACPRGPALGPVLGACLCRLCSARGACACWPCSCVPASAGTVRSQEWGMRAVRAWFGGLRGGSEHTAAPLCTSPGSCVCLCV